MDTHNHNKFVLLMGCNPGLVVMGEDSFSEGCEFESQHCILDEHLFVLRIVLFARKDENKQKEAEDGPATSFLMNGQLLDPKTLRVERWSTQMLTYLGR